MSDDTNIPKRSGTFSISPSRVIYGELTLAGRNTLLYLRDNERFDIYRIPDQCILGTLYDLKKVSLIDCYSSGPGSFDRAQNTARRDRGFVDLGPDTREGVADSIGDRCRGRNGAAFSHAFHAVFGMRGRGV